MKFDFDVDIDMFDRNKLLDVIQHTPASICKEEQFTKHNTGVYLQDIPFYPLESYSSIDHKQAEAEGWFKLDVLNNSIYKDVRDEAHLEKLLNDDVMWELFGHQEVVEKLFHINSHFGIVKQHLPTNIDQLAMILAMIRPGKRHLVGKSWEEIEANVWVKPLDNIYFFKKSHSYSYAVAIKVQLNLLCEG
jgi:hypothetical protein|tara:strand:- start:24291 stop:24860 length:570 start_codon:yes stop_codon:yes gene_type:complete